MSSYENELQSEFMSRVEAAVAAGEIPAITNEHGQLQCEVIAMTYWTVRNTKLLNRQPYKVLYTAENFAPKTHEQGCKCDRCEKSRWLHRWAIKQCRRVGVNNG